MTQSDRLLDWLQRGKRITALDAYDRLGIMQVATRVFELKKAGHPVKTRSIKVINKFGEALTIKEYFLNVPSSQ